MHKIYEEKSGETVLLVEASSAFNSAYSNAFLHNVEISCASISPYLKRCYSFSTQLFIIDGWKNPVNGRDISRQYGCHDNSCNRKKVYKETTIPSRALSS